MFNGVNKCVPHDPGPKAQFLFNKMETFLASFDGHLQLEITGGKMLRHFKVLLYSIYTSEQFAFRIGDNLQKLVKGNC